MQALVLGIRGVLVAENDFQLAAIQAAGRCLSAAGVDAACFTNAARRRLRAHGPRAIISRTLNDLDLPVAADWVRRADLEAARAVPSVSPEPALRSTLRFLGSAVPVAFLERGSARVLDALWSRFGLADITTRRLWAERLGHAAEPPRSMAFRWLARRMGLRPWQLLYVAGDGEMQQAAEAAGCRCARTPTENVGNLEWLVERLEWHHAGATHEPPR